jgi:hypothetical protein
MTVQGNVGLPLRAKRLPRARRAELGGLVRSVWHRTG